MKKFYVSFSLILLTLLFSLTGCVGPGRQREISRALELELPRGRITESYRSHSWNGDGITFLALEFPGDTPEALLAQDSRWLPWPPAPETEVSLYGREGFLADLTGCLTAEDGRSLLPPVEEGFYFLLDRQTGSTGAVGDLFEAWSLNLTLALYDTGSRTLYYCTFDT